MEIIRNASAGTLESCDCMVLVTPSGDDKVRVEIDSIVYAQYGEAIRETVNRVLDEFQVKGAQVRVQDRGAYDCVIEARVETALMRAAEEEKE